MLRVEATVPLAVDDAFSLFADRLDALWPPDSALAAIEATLTLWEPPRRIRATWTPGSHVDILFAEVDKDLTTVIVEHRDLAVHDSALRRLVAGDDGWWAALRRYAAAARSSPLPKA
jgi:hypothetical protein